MIYFQVFINWLTERLTSTFRGEAAVNVFCKSVNVFLLLKIIFISPTSFLLFQYAHREDSHAIIENLLLWPCHISYTAFIFFFWISILVVALFIILRRNYLGALITFWIALNYHFINALSSDGSDFVLLLLLFFAIPLSSFPRIRNEKFYILQKAIYNTALVGCQIQIGLIYLLSGLNKVTTRPWQTGEAFKLIAKLDFLMNPHLVEYFPDNYLEGFLASWIIILFELLFIFLIWFKETRYILLLTGVVMHLFIWIVLSLPDFGMIMIISYVIFLGKEPRQDTVLDASS